MKSKQDIMEQISTHRNKIAQLEKELERYYKAVSIDAEKPFCEMNLNERAQILDYDSGIYQIFVDAPTTTIKEYNTTCKVGNEILLEY